ncbi:MAG: hypothetical protein J7641_07675 [Cyanobacteria bacterium SID2]|nr:hypothetical protein [Cyanobacteria bacterium SID2]MBP0005455.1 hypothetical protein [Cyanobacteria bacterium SBC]
MSIGSADIFSNQTLLSLPRSNASPNVPSVTAVARSTQEFALGSVTTSRIERQDELGNQPFEPRDDNEGQPKDTVG